MKTYILHHRIKHHLRLIIIVLIVCGALCMQNRLYAQKKTSDNLNLVSTFSIIACDPEAGELGGGKIWSQLCCAGKHPGW